MPPYLNLRLKDADILRLHPDDIVMLNISRPLASSERDMMIAAWKTLMQARGLESVDLVILGGVETEVKVMRKE